MRARLPVFASLLAAALGAAAAPGLAQALKMPKVELDFDEGADFSAFHTYSWKDPAAPAKDPQMHTRIIWYVERELEKKGLKKAPEGQGELFVRYYAKGKEGLKGTPTQGQSYLPGGAGQLTTGVDFRNVAEGTLILELQRATDEKAVWRAGTGYTSIDKKRIDADTASAVRLLISKYPPPRP
jgi:hypothetical protein